MVRLHRPGAWMPALCGCVLLAVAAAAAVYLAAQPHGSNRHDGFLAYGEISVAIVGEEINTVRSKRCMADSVQAGISIRQGTPVVISLDGSAVGGGDLSTGRLEHEVPHRGDAESWRATCSYKFSAPVTRPGDGQYTVDIGGAKVAFSVDDLRNGISLDLS
jgi:hypothetical protein